MHTPLFYRSKAVFGLDIGQETVRVAQINGTRRALQVGGYGLGAFDASALKNGEIIKPEIIAEAIKSLLKQSITGKITTNRIVASIPSSRTFTRILELPKMSDKDLNEAVRLESEQYIPIPLDQLYIEHMVLNIDSQKAGVETHPVLMVATPKSIVDSYLHLFDLLGLEVESLEPSLFAIIRAVHFTRPATTPKIIIDFGAHSCDIVIYDGVVRLINTIDFGGETITENIAKSLKITYAEANSFKALYGIDKSPWQAKLAQDLQPILNNLITEVQKMLRYYYERGDKKSTIGEILVVGGGANLPGLTDFLSHLSGVLVSSINPWEKLIIKPLKLPDRLQTTLYNTVIGLALNPHEAA